MPLKLQVLDTSHGRCLSVGGEVDMDSSPELRREMLKQLKGHSGLVIDLSGVGYIDSSGIAVLIEGHNEAHRGGGKLTLLRPSEAVTSVIDLAHLREFFSIQADEAS